MTQADVFLADISARPDDEALRLIYADWLEDQGEADLAALVRLEIQLRPLSLWSSERYRLSKSFRRLERGWAARMPRRKGVWWSFRRRAVTLVASSARAFERHGAELLDSTRVQVLKLESALRFERLAGCLHLNRVGALDLGHLGLGDGQVRALAASP